MSLVDGDDAISAAIEMFNALTRGYTAQVRRFETVDMDPACINLGTYIALRVMVKKWGLEIGELSDEHKARLEEWIAEVDSLPEHSPDMPKATA